MDTTKVRQEMQPTQGDLNIPKRRWETERRVVYL